MKLAGVEIPMRPSTILLVLAWLLGAVIASTNSLSLTLVWALLGAGARNAVFDR